MDKQYNDNRLLLKFLCMAYNYCNDETTQRNTKEGK